MTEVKPILTIAPEDFPGTTAVLKHYNVTGLVEHSDEISPRTVAGRKMVVLGGWHHIYYEAVRKIQSSNVPIGLYWTSSVGQMDFSNNGIEVSYIHIIADLVRTELIDFVFCANPDIQNCLQQFIPQDKVIHLPYAFDWDEVKKHQIDDIYVGKDWVDLFCPGDTRKNMLVQIHAAKIADVHLHGSGLRPRYKWFSDLIKVRYTDMGWMPKDKYYQAVQTMKMGLQVTYAETFDYVVAEHFALKRPCLISTVMGRWVDKKLWKDLMVHNLDDPFEVANLIENIIHMTKKQQKGLNIRCYNFMKKEAEQRNILASNILNEALETVSKR